MLVAIIDDDQREPLFRAEAGFAEVASESDAVPDLIADHYIHSSLREQILEHIFISEALRVMWRMGYRDMEVLRSEVDNAGYDIVLAHRGIIRHIQLKTSHAGASTARQTVHLALAAKPSGCVIWLRFDPASLEMVSFLWLGGQPGAPLPDIRDLPVARHTKGNAEGTKLERPNLRQVPRSSFVELRTMDEVIGKLFGPAGP